MKCLPDCQCKRHQNSGNFSGSSNPCKPGCTCKRHPKIRTEIGQRFTRWTVTEVGIKMEGKWASRVKCDCGTEKIVREVALINGNPRSCGCLQRDALSDISRTHGMTQHPLYVKWKSMMGRCSEKSNQRKDYVDRGITVCERWQDPVTFITDIESSIGLCPPKMSLDRIDNDGNYEPGNVRWATHSQQMRNRRISKNRRC